MPALLIMNYEITDLEAIEAYKSKSSATLSGPSLADTTDAG